MYILALLLLLLLLLLMLLCLTSLMSLTRAIRRLTQLLQPHCDLRKVRVTVPILLPTRALRLLTYNYLRQRDRVFAFLYLYVSRITQKLTNFGEFLPRDDA